MAETADIPMRWDAERRARAYVELEHPSDLFLEIHGRDLPDLFENGLVALYDQIARLDEVETRRELRLDLEAPALDEALRSLLAEALYRFDTEDFVAAGAEVRVDGGPEGQTAAGRLWRVRARLSGETADRERHALLHEIKAVTYHRLAVSKGDAGWTATVLLDI